MKRRASFIERFIHAQGECEVPPEFFRWAGISIIAACLDNRVFYEKFRGSKLLPNLYTMLIGGSGLGKGIAIDAAMKLVADVPEINAYRGKATAPHLIDHMGRNARPRGGEDPTTLQIDHSRLYLVTPELSMSVGSGPMADVFVKFLTELYTGGDYTFQEGTRTHGGVVIKNPRINWFAGTTEQWLVNSITPDAIEGGFFARVAAVCQDYNFHKQVLRPSYPADYDEVMEWLRKRIRWMCRVAGQVALSNEAAMIEESWYYSREVPVDTSLLPSWKREHDMVLKLAMIFMINERPDELIIRDQHMVSAQQTTKTLMRDIPRLITLAQVTPESRVLQFVKRIVRSAGTIPMRILYFTASQRGITKDRVEAALDTLVASGEIEALENSTVGWRKR